MNNNNNNIDIIKQKWKLINFLIEEKNDDQTNIYDKITLNNNNNKGESNNNAKIQ